jgi:hypothetical protein
MASVSFVRCTMLSGSFAASMSASWRAHRRLSS